MTASWPNSMSWPHEFCLNKGKLLRKFFILTSEVYKYVKDFNINRNNNCLSYYLVCHCGLVLLLTMENPVFFFIAFCVSFWQQIVFAYAVECKTHSDCKGWFRQWSCCLDSTMKRTCVRGAECLSQEYCLTDHDCGNPEFCWRFNKCVKDGCLRCTVNYSFSMRLLVFMIVLENTAAQIMYVLEMENVVVLGNVLMKDVIISVPQTLNVVRMNIVVREEILGLGLSEETHVLKVV